MSTAAELKQRGNDAFAAKRYAEALAFYDEATQLEPGNIDLHNNAAAALHGLQRYGDAIERARRSLAVQDNHKAHSRVGAALWAMGRLPDALREYEQAAALAPGTAAIDEAMQSLRRMIATPVSRPPGPPGLTGAIADGAVALLAAVALIGLFVAPRVRAGAWTLLLCAALLRAGLVAHSRGLIRMDRAVVATWAGHRCTLELCLCALALLCGAPPQMLLSTALGLYGAASFAAGQRALAFLPPLLHPLLRRVSANRDVILLYAATLEAITLFTVMLNGGAIFTLVYIQYIKYLYAVDRNVAYAFAGLRSNISRLTRHPLAPAFVDRGVQKFCDLLHTLATQTQ